MSSHPIFTGIVALGAAFVLFLVLPMIARPLSEIVVPLSGLLFPSPFSMSDSQALATPAPSTSPSTHLKQTMEKNGIILSAKTQQTINGLKNLDRTSIRRAIQSGRR